MAPTCLEPRGTSCPDRQELLMTSSGKIRIYELSKDLGLENKDVLHAAEKLSIAAKSHSSSISDDEAKRIRGLLRQGSAANSAPPSKSEPGKTILSVKKAAPTAIKDVAPPMRKATSSSEISQVKPSAPANPTPTSPERPSTESVAHPAPPTRPVNPTPTPTSSPPKTAARPVNAPISFFLMIRRPT